MSYHVETKRFKQLVEDSKQLMEDCSVYDLPQEIRNGINKICAGLALLDIRARCGNDMADEVEQLLNMF